MREVVAVFDGPDALEKAVYALETHGFDRAAFSLLASEEAVAQRLGHRYRRVRDTEDDPEVPRDTFFSRVSRLEAEYLPAPALAAVGGLMLAGTGTLVPTVIAAGGGAVIGAILGRLMHQHHTVRIGEQLERGGLLLWVSIRNAREEETALEVLHNYAAHDVHTHEIPA